MVTTSLLEINIRWLLERVEMIAGIRLPKKIIEVSLSEGVLHIRFAYPKTRETEGEPLPLEAPAVLFRDEETGEITALEIVDIDDALEELGRIAR